jgi:hypothetical protein
MSIDDLGNHLAAAAAIPRGGVTPGQASG